MDRVRFGRALGAGAREAAKALVKAADAAAAPNPAGNAPRRPAAAAEAGSMRAGSHAEVLSPAADGRARQGDTRPVGKTRVTREGLKRGSRRFGEAAWGPVARAGNVLWLEVTGVLFGMFAAAAGVAVWRARAGFRLGGAPMQHAWFAVLMFVVFGYFTVTSYVRAARRGRR